VSLAVCETTSAPWAFNVSFHDQLPDRGIAMQPHGLLRAHAEDPEVVLQLLQVCFFSEMPNSFRWQYHHMTHDTQTSGAPTVNNAKPAMLTLVSTDSATLHMTAQIAPRNTSAASQPAYQTHHRRF
jgi:hypothetical protein